MCLKAIVPYVADRSSRLLRAIAFETEDSSIPIKSDRISHNCAIAIYYNFRYILLLLYVYKFTR